MELIFPALQTIACPVTVRAADVHRPMLGKLGQHRCDLGVRDIVGIDQQRDLAVGNRPRAIIAIGRLRQWAPLLLKPQSAPNKPHERRGQALLPAPPANAVHPR